MNASAVLAALLTSIWVWRDWRITQESDTAVSRKATDKYYEQKKITDPSILTSLVNTPKKQPHGKPIISKTSTFVAQRVSDILRLSIQRPNSTALRLTWSAELLRTSLDMWESERIILSISNRTVFLDHDMADVVSFSTYEDGILNITTGFLLQGEVDLPSWQPLHAYL